MEDTALYPIGQQNFREFREDGCIYIDKTRYIAKIVDSKIRYWFLARPRRFGKSLFLSTLEYFFKGERELFKELFIDSVDWDWKAYPVLRLDLNVEKYREQGVLDKILSDLFKKWEEKYGVAEIASTLSGRFQGIIEAAHRKTGRQVVILVDEYDKPLVNNLNDDEGFEHYRTRLAAVYSNFKSSAEHIKLVFLTGVSRFSKLGVFSDLNNLREITCYLTIKSYDFRTDSVTLGVPNKEVKESLFENLVPFYIKAKRGTALGVVFDIIDDLQDGNPEKRSAPLMAASTLR